MSSWLFGIRIGLVGVGLGCLLLDNNKSVRRCFVGGVNRRLLNFPWMVGGGWWNLFLCLCSDKVTLATQMYSTKETTVSTPTTTSKQQERDCGWGLDEVKKVDSLFQNLARRPCVLAEANLAHVLSLNLKKSHLDEKRPSARHSRFE